jgi:hypothetical protein
MPTEATSLHIYFGAFVFIKRVVFATFGGFSWEVSVTPEITPIDSPRAGISKKNRKKKCYLGGQVTLPVSCVPIFTQPVIFDSCRLP